VIEPEVWVKDQEMISATTGHQSKSKMLQDPKRMMEELFKVFHHKIQIMGQTHLVKTLL